MPRAKHPCCDQKKYPPFQYAGLLPLNTPDSRIHRPMHPLDTNLPIFTNCDMIVQLIDGVHLSHFLQLSNRRLGTPSLKVFLDNTEILVILLKKTSSLLYIITHVSVSVNQASTRTHFVNLTGCLPPSYSSHHDTKHDKRKRRETRSSSVTQYAAVAAESFFCNELLLRSLQARTLFLDGVACKSASTSPTTISPVSAIQSLSFYRDIEAP